MLMDQPTDFAINFAIFTLDHARHVLAAARNYTVRPAGFAYEKDAVGTARVLHVEPSSRAQLGGRFRVLETK